MTVNTRPCPHRHRYPRRRRIEHYGDEACAPRVYYVTKRGSGERRVAGWNETDF